MRFAWTIALVGWMAAASAGQAFASDFPSLDPARATVAARVETLKKSDAQLEQDRNLQEELAHRIAALKRLHAQKNFSEDPQLEKLLQLSVEAEKALTAQLQARDAAASALTAAVNSAIRAIDQEITAKKPELTRGSQDARATAARNLRALLDLRKEMEQQGRSTSNRTPESWARYQVTIGPLDGPSELREKADFVDDTRDKLAKKRAALESLIKEAQQEREIAKASNNFRTQTSHFDEETRTGHVTRQTSAAARTTPTLSESINGKTAQSAADNTHANSDSVPPSTPNDPAAFSGTPSPPPSNSGPGGARTGGVTSNPTTNLGGGSSNNSATTNANSNANANGSATLGALSPTSGMPPQLDPSTLLNLRVEDLDGRGVDLLAIQSLMQDLAKLDARLRAQSAEIRRRAQHLEDDETKALGKDK